MQSKRTPLFIARPFWFVAGTVMLLGACQDRTAPLVDDATEEAKEFTLTSAGAEAAQTANIVGMHRLPILSLRTVAQPAFSTVPTTNSPFDLTFFGGQVVKT